MPGSWCAELLPRNPYHTVYTPEVPIIGFAAIFAWAAANTFLLPIRLGSTFAGAMRFRFRNPEYHELVMSMVREQAPDRRFSAEALQWQP